MKRDWSSVCELWFLGFPFSNGQPTKIQKVRSNHVQTLIVFIDAWSAKMFLEIFHNQPTIYIGYIFVSHVAIWKEILFLFNINIKLITQITCNTINNDLSLSGINCTSVLFFCQYYVNYGTYIVCACSSKFHLDQTSDKVRLYSIISIINSKA